MNRFFVAALLLATITSCSKSPEEQSPASSTMNQDTSEKPQLENAMTNPLLGDWDTPYGIPPFSLVKNEHFKPAFDKTIALWQKDIAAIESLDSEPDFENTIVALEMAGNELTKVLKVFSNLSATDTNDAIKALQVEIYPELTRQQDAILLSPTLFSRVKAVYEKRESMNLDQQDARLLALTYEDFIRSGAGLDDEAKAKLKEINAEISKQTTTFSQNLLAETKSFELVVENKDDLAGLSTQMVNAAKAKAEAKGKGDAWVFGLDRATFEGFMTSSENRELRKKMFDGYRSRGAQANDSDNRQVLMNIASLRAERAELLGYASHAHYQLETRMAKTPKITEEFLLRVWQPGLKRAAEEKAEMQQIIDSEGHDFELAGHDWWHYAEKLRSKKYAFDESQVKPYFELDNVIAGAFYVAQKLFGLSFKELSDVPKWHPNVKVYEVFGENGEHLGVFLADFYSRDSKRGGAWMSSFRSASNIADAAIRPLINNNMNLTPPAEGDPTLLSFGQVNTLFHEFGHGLHGLMTQARYERYAGTSGSPRDFTEFPAQFMEHYAAAPEVLPVYALHYETGEVLPQALLDKLQAASNHNQGFKTTEFIAASLLDMAWHTLDLETAKSIADADAFEDKVLREYGLPEEIGPRYKSPYFAHIFSSPSGYSAGYYAYLWSEILDTDGFAAFREAGDIYDPELAGRLAEFVYEAGGLAPADELYRSFRGKDPTIEPLLKNRGFE